MWSSAASLGEMAALFPLKGPIFEFPRRFLDESLGYAVGWMTWYGGNSQGLPFVISLM
jgi:amino acid transporter